MAAPAAYVDGPPPAHTGGFGEPTCRECHFDGPPDAPAGSLSVTGFPDRWSPGATYAIDVRLTHPELARAGFQLAIRWTEEPRAAVSAGVLEADGSGRARIAAADSGGVRYAQHGLEGSRPEEPGRATWRLSWRAPAESGGPVALHVAANAANGDDSAFGDYVYSRSLTAEAPRR